MKLIQINAWLGRLNGPLERFISNEQPDFICMQEAYLPNPAGPTIVADQFNFLEQVRAASGLEYEFFAKNWGLTIGEALYIEGNVILSRFPLSDQQSRHTHGKYHIRNNNASAVPNSRIYQTAIVSLPDGRRLSLANYHGYLDGPHGIGTEMTTRTMGSFRDAISVLPHPAIACGDLNAWPASPAIKLLDDLGFENLTISHNLASTLSDVHRAPAEDRAIATSDYILVSPEVNVTSFQASEKILSDHKALILEFEL